ncbi:hypothetical protein P3X46_033448 [Hevea brasiliensis]|uniref:Endonuclease/exonuclease/phosphatase domain-containing protein n=1 Tax=Hevea brasiliensis TaxID=3981 RepID=A0ABQ9KGH0_HEVBR|nr:uncharacterized protein LOC110670593 isoform X1 [Hevea brasiliensis]XP_057997229.1 uncharacterized protein LOC110670593 isoform X1 [Hevea brasiliensis]KAJ9136360.1 hypothetical protein P3X46_033448 [Hevea brasiliensis]
MEEVNNTRKRDRKLVRTRDEDTSRVNSEAARNRDRELMRTRDQDTGRVNSEPLGNFAGQGSNGQSLSDEDPLCLHSSDHPGMVPVTAPLIYDESKTPMVYQIQRQIASISQENMSVTVYYTKLKKLWDELNSIDPIPSCTCGTAKYISDLFNRNKIMQFLMGLNEGYDQARNQILLLDPLPNINEVYSMILKVESQRQVFNDFSESAGSVSTMVKPAGIYIIPSKRDRELTRKEKGHCDYCNMDGHKRESCFKLTGYPEWYSKDRNKTQPKMAAKVSTTFHGSNFGSETPLDDHIDNIDSSLINTGYEEKESALATLKQQMMKLLQGKGIESQSQLAATNFTEDISSSAILSSIKILSYNVWFREDLELNERMKALGDLIQLHSPDVICFQEVTPNIYDVFRQSSWWKAYQCSVANEMAYLRRYFCMQLCKLPVKSFNSRPFNNSVMGRQLCFVELEVQPNKPLVVATSHLESPCPAPPTWDQMFSKERVDQVTEATDFLKKNPNVIFGGDMNWDDELDGQFPLPDGWVDAWTELRPGDNGWTYDTMSNRMLSGNRTLQKRLDRFVCNLRDFRISKIEMIGMEAIPGLSHIKEKKVSKEVMMLKLPVFPSDHYGLLLTISGR